MLAIGDGSVPSPFVTRKSTQLQREILPKQNICNTGIYGGEWPGWLPSTPLKPADRTLYDSFYIRSNLRNSVTQNTNAQTDEQTIDLIFM